MSTPADRVAVEMTPIEARTLLALLREIEPRYLFSVMRDGRRTAALNRIPARLEAALAAGEKVVLAGINLKGEARDRIRSRAVRLSRAEHLSTRAIGVQLDISHTTARKLLNEAGIGRPASSLTRCPECECCTDAKCARNTCPPECPDHFGGE